MGDDMNDRDLHLIEYNDGAVEAEFLKYPQYGTPYYTRRLLMGKEIEKARKIIKNEDKYAIDNFCYSIA